MTNHPEGLTLSEVVRQKEELDLYLHCKSALTTRFVYTRRLLRSEDFR